jgi:hypothetical protein
MSIVNDLDDNVSESLLAKVDAFREAGMSDKAAQIAAVDSMLAELGVESDSTPGDMFSDDFAYPGTQVDTGIAISSKGETMLGGNKNSDGQKITATKQGLTNFWNWFGRSEATDDIGNPLVLYHSTNADTNTLKPNRKTINNYGILGDVETSRAGIFTTPDKEFSQQYLREGDGKNVMQVYMSLQQPFDFREPDGAFMRQLERMGFLTQWKNSQNDWSMFDNDDDGKNPFVAALKERDFDGAIFNEDDENGESHVTYMAFDSNQIKSATGNKGTYGKSDDIRNSARDLGFYSELAAQIQKNTMKQAPASEWKSFIKALSAKGVKADEIEWSGVIDWLDLQEGKVTKDALSNFLESEGVQIEETVLGESPDVMEYMVYGRRLGRDVLIGVYDTEEEADDFVNSADQDQTLRVVENANPDKASPASTKYEQYKLDGGENYREVLLTLPSEKPTISKYAAIKGISESAAIADRAGFTAWRKEQTESRPDYQSAHWDQTNVIAHIRTTDRYDANGASVMFIEELQSDYQQDYRKAIKTIADSVESDFHGIVKRMKEAGVLEVNCE